MSPERKPPDATIPIFPLIRRLTGIRLREGLEMEYALALITDSQPQINLLGQFKNRITPDQAEMVDQGIKDSQQRWDDMRALIRSIPPSTPKS